MTDGKDLASRRRRLWAEALMYSPVLLCLAIMVPRLLSAQFGLFDDPATLGTARQIVADGWRFFENDWDALTGRFRPIYWLFYSLVYAVMGENPFRFYLANTLVFAFITAGLVRWVRLNDGSRLAAWASGVLFALSGPVIENFYTLSKGEPVQVICIMACLLTIQLYGSARSRAARLGIILVTSFFCLLANASKETTLAMVPISLGWYMLAWGRRKLSHDGRGLGIRSGFLWANVLGAFAAWILRSSLGVHSVASGIYTNDYRLELSSILVSAFRWAGWLTRDYAYLIPLGAFLIGCGLLGRKLPRLGFMLETLVWMAGWVLVFLPWRTTLEYYILPFAVGCAAFAGTALDHAIRGLTASRQLERVAAGVALGLSLPLLLIAVANNVSNGRIQLAVDAANEEMLNYMAGHLPQGSLLLVNIQSPNEYYDAIGWHLSELGDRADIRLDYVRMEEGQIETTGRSSLYLLEPQIHNQPLLAVRMGVIEQTVGHWNESLESFLSREAELAFETEHHFRLSYVNFLQLFCPLFPQRNYCVEADPAVDRRVFSYGWRLYRIRPMASGSP